MAPVSSSHHPFPSQKQTTQQGHSLWFLIHVAGISNPREMVGFFNRGFVATAPGLTANSSLFAVDVFFAIAGFLAIFLFVKELEKVG